MVDLTGDEHLKDDERWARRLLEGTVGQTRVTDRKGCPEGRHDLEAVLPDGRIAAIEITSEADQARLSVAAAARRHLSTVTVPSSQFAWLVNVTPQANVRALRKSAGLVALLTDMEQQGQSSASALSDYRDPWRDRLEAFGIQSVHGLEGSARPGAVYVVPDIVASYGWMRPTADNDRRNSAHNRGNLRRAIPRMFEPFRSAESAATSRDDGRLTTPHSL